MFKINPAPTFHAPVSLSIPGAESPAIVKVEFRHKSRTEFMAWWEKSQKRKAVDALADVIVSWGEEVIDQDGKPLAYSKEALAQLLDNYHASGTEILQTYYRELVESRKKN